MVVQSDCSVSSLSLSLRDKEREREKREIKLDNCAYDICSYYDPKIVKQGNGLK